MDDPTELMKLENFQYYLQVHVWYFRPQTPCTVLNQHSNCYFALSTRFFDLLTGPPMEWTHFSKITPFYCRLIVITIFKCEKRDQDVYASYLEWKGWDVGCAREMLKRMKNHFEALILAFSSVVPTKSHVTQTSALHGFNGLIPEHRTTEQETPFCVCFSHSPILH